MNRGMGEPGKERVGEEERVWKRGTGDQGQIGEYRNRARGIF